jgi:proteasome lid subunit RPN8/RPN11
VIALGEASVGTIREHGLQTYPEECCGALLGRFVEALPVVEQAWPIVNIRPDTRRRRFLVDPRDYLKVEREAARRGLEVLGFYHSHPDHPALPSEFDRQHAWPNLHYVIVEVDGGVPREMTSWLLSEDRSIMREEPILPARRTA